MAKEIVMPKVGLNEDSYILAQWYVKPGDIVKVGQPIFSVESDKATTDVESDCDGVVLQLLYGEYDEVPAMAPVCYIGQPGEAVPDTPAAPLTQQTPSSAQVSPNTDPVLNETLPEGVTPVVMPKVGLNEDSYILASWNVKEGDMVTPGQTLFSVESDKATTDIDSEVGGCVLKLLYGEYDEVPAMAPVCYIGPKGTDVSSLQGVASAASPAPGAPVQPAQTQNEIPCAIPGAIRIDIRPKKAPAPPAPVPPAPTPTAAAAPSALEAKPKPLPHVPPAAPAAPQENGRIFASPRAKALAEEKGVDIARVPAEAFGKRVVEADVQHYQGPSCAPCHNGRIFASPRARALAKAKGIDIALVPALSFGKRVTEADVQKYVPAEIAAQPAPRVVFEDFAMETQSVKLSRMRQVIAKNMMRSLTSSAQLTVHRSIDATKMMEKHKANKAISYNGMILKACSIALNDFRYLNANLDDGDTITLFGEKNIGFACDTERGLVVPVVKNVETKTEQQISQEMKELASQCHDGTIKPAQMAGATFTVTTLGSQGIEYFTPILNYPQTGILGVGAITQRVRKTAFGMEVYPAITVSLTFDHRAIDGAPAALFVKRLAEILEQ